MKRWDAVLALLLLFAVTARAMELRDLEEEYRIPRAAHPVRIDGRLDEWDMDTPYVLSATTTDGENSVYSNDPTNPVQGDEDFSARVALAWDERYLYVAGEVTDDHLLGVKPDSDHNQGPPGWGCDSLMIALASFRQPLRSNSPFQRTPLLALRYAPQGPATRGGLVESAPGALDRRDLHWMLTPHSRLGVAETPGGYNVEAAIPWEDLDFAPAAGERLFIAFLGADMDPGEALNQVGWRYDGDPRRHPSFRLADESGVLGLLTVAREQIAQGSSWAVRAELEAHAQAAMWDALRIVDSAGRTVAEHAIGREVPRGRKGVLFRDFDPDTFAQPDDYEIKIKASWPGSGDGPRTVARAALRVTVPEPVRPAVVSRPGEIHHMGPDRVAHNAFMEHRQGFYRHGFVKGSQDYVSYIRKHLEPGLKNQTRLSIQHKHPWGYVNALRCLALHRLTDDAEYAELARDVMDYQLDVGDLGWFKLTGVAQYRYLTWMQNADSPFAPPDAERRYRSRLYDVAAEPSKDLFAESGTHNRVWHRYALLTIARQVAEEDGQPVDPRIVEYTDYHKDLIGDVGDADDASAGYHWVFFDAAMAIYFHTGDWDAFLSNRGFVKTLSRYVEMVSPSGACAPFASCSGWPEVGASMWAYEWMSRLTRNGRFRWTSHRIAEYYYNHLDYRASQYHLPYDTALNNFALAYLLADDDVPPVPPPAGSRLTWRHPLEPVPLERRQARPGTSPMEMVADKWIPDKVVLSSGTGAQDFWGLIELLPVAGHGGELPGNILALMFHDAALFAGQGYYENTPEFQNILWIEDLEGLAADPRLPSTEVPFFVDDPAFTYVRVVSAPYQRLPVTYTRDVVFVKTGFMVVKDRVRFDSTMKVRVGPCYYARSLGPECGENWFNAYYSQLYYTGLGLGRGVQAIRNPSWDLMIFFAPREGRIHTVQDRFPENPYRNSPIQVRQAWSGIAEAGREITFTSVLLPHAPVFQPSQRIEPDPEGGEPARIVVARDDDAVTVIKAVAERDPVNKIRYETWVLLNETGEAVSGGPLASDGRLAVVGYDPQGEIAHRVVLEGASLIHRGADESAHARRPSVGPAVLPAELRE